MADDRTAELAASLASTQAALEELIDVVEEQGRLIMRLYAAIGTIAELPEPVSGETSSGLRHGDAFAEISPARRRS